MENIQYPLFFRRGKNTLAKILNEDDNLVILSGKEPSIMTNTLSNEHYSDSEYYKKCTREDFDEEYKKTVAAINKLSSL